MFLSGVHWAVWSFPAVWLQLDCGELFNSGQLLSCPPKADHAAVQKAGKITLMDLIIPGKLALRQGVAFAYDTLLKRIRIAGEKL